MCVCVCVCVCVCEQCDRRAKPIYANEIKCSLLRKRDRTNILENCRILTRNVLSNFQEHFRGSFEAVALPSRLLKWPMESSLHFSHGELRNTTCTYFFVPRSLYAVAVGGAVVVVVLEVAMKRPENFICLAGLALLIIFCFLIYKEPEKV